MATTGNEKGEWKTIKGVHVFIRDGESATDALNRTIAKANEDKKAKDIANRQKEIDRLNGKSSKATGKEDTTSHLKSIARAIKREYMKSGDLEDAFQKVLKSDKWAKEQNKKDGLTIAQRYVIGEALGEDIFHENGVMSTSWLSWFDDLDDDEE